MVLKIRGCLNMNRVFKEIILDTVTRKTPPYLWPSLQAKTSLRIYNGKITHGKKYKYLCSLQTCHIIFFSSFLRDTHIIIFVLCTNSKWRASKICIYIFSFSFFYRGLRNHLVILCKILVVYTFIT